MAMRSKIRGKMSQLRLRLQGVRTRFSFQALPPRGTGLGTGRAGPRRMGRPRTDAERRERHF